MINLFTVILSSIFLLISIIHFYWGFGGKWGSSSVIPTVDRDTKVIMPGAVPTFTVALGMLGFCFFVLIKGRLIKLSLPYWLDQSGLWIIFGIFILRAVGEFNYVGFFKKVKNTKFAENDTRYYSPLCLLIGIAALIIELSI